MNVQLGGEIHTHVELDGKEVGDATTPIVDRNFGRIDKHKKRGRIKHVQSWRKIR